MTDERLAEIEARLRSMAASSDDAEFTQRGLRLIEAIKMLDRVRDDLEAERDRLLRDQGIP